MRFRRIKLDHFRGVDSAEIEFSDAVTVVEGPNEVGKSTVAEAITVLFDHLDSSRRQEVRAAHQIGADVGPYVELEFRVGDYEITYAKRFVRKPSTLLRIDSPLPEQHTGREAHERMLTILKETVDDSLWAAMRVAQGESLRQPDLADVGALRAALDGDGRERAAADSDSELMSRVVAEYTRYFTPRTGQPTGELSAAVDAHVAAREAYDGAQADLEAVEAQVARFAALDTELERLGAEEHRHAARLAELTEQERALEVLRRAHTDAVAQTETAAGDLGTADRAVADRDALIGEAQERRVAAAEFGDEVARLRTAAQQARAIADDVRERARTARTAAQKAERAHRVVTDALQTVRLGRDATELDERVVRASDARDRIVTAEAVLSSGEVDDELLQRLVGLDADVRTAHELLRAGAATVEVESLGTDPLSVDGEAPEAGPRAVLQPTTVEVPGVVRVTVRPGRAGADLEADLRAAEHALAAGLADAGVEDVRAAREAVSKRRDAETECEIARDRLREALGDADDFDALMSRASGVRDRYHRLLARLVDGAELPSSVDAAEADAESARIAYDEAVAEAEALERDAHEGERAAADQRESLIRAEQRQESDAAEVDRLEKRIGAERDAASDDSLRDAAAAARSKLDEATAARDRSATALSEAGSDDLGSLLENARGAEQRLARARRDLEDEQQQVNGQLDGFATRGLHDQHEAASAALERAENALSGVEARADAARMLHDTLQRHRDTARQRYVAPFKRAIESLGRVVFGDDLSVEVADDLTIVSRTSRGRTVAFESLSGGTREQLAILGRLAAAGLVDPEDGAPLVLDDAFGHADPDRLERIAAVINRAARTTQIVILTCHPERFRAVGSAATVRLAPHRTGDMRHS